MKYLGLPGGRLARRRARRVTRLLGAVAIFAVTALALALTQRETAAPEAATAQDQDVFEIALPGQDDEPLALTPGGETGQPRLPFEPLVPGRHASKVGSNVNWTPVTVAPGDNLSLIFSRLKLSKRDLHRIVEADRERRELRNLRPGQVIRIDADDGELNRLIVELDALNSLWFERTANGYSARIETVEPEVRVAAATTSITHSLFVDGQHAGLSDAMIMKLTDIFGWDIDFALDIRKNDHFSVIYEEVYKDGLLVKPGRILAAEFVNRGTSHRAVLYTNGQGESAYYSEDGKAMRKAFLRTPVNFTRISSKFNLGRRHPILNTIRAHRGVDYAAPMGTPIRATANGSVRSVGKSGGYGLAIELQHGRAYSTLYAHMSRFAKGIKRGMSVKQGQIIGYVGKSGLATGPHLHYEFRVNGVHRNPLTVELPKAEPLDKRYLTDFRSRTAPFMAQLDTLYATSGQPDPQLLAELDPASLAGVPNRSRN
ncbi:MAG: peptidoglycan DD-metalloendopeptidase family protein [Gammaproteobacteria bacterium]|nr:peptidoglycan DD-metalloendopeptidase family protein [Gammaproteobacteria bacterium]